MMTTRHSQPSNTCIRETIVRTDLLGRVDEEGPRHIGAVAFVPRTQGADDDVVAQVLRVALGAGLPSQHQRKKRNTSSCIQ